MSPIQYQQATYALSLRDKLELAGCDARVAALLSSAVGEVIEHVTHILTRDIEMRKHDLYDRLIGVTLLVIAAAVICGVLIALLR